MEPRKPALRWVLDNLSLIVLAIVGGLVAWGLVSLGQNPILDAALTARVVRIGESERTDVSITQDLPQTITVSVRAPRNVIQAIEERGIVVPVDFRELPAGLSVIPLTPTIDATPIQLRSTQPATGSVVLVPLVHQQLPAIVSVVGTPALGFRAGATQITPPQVFITGTQAEMSRVVSVNAIVSVDGARATVDQTVRLFARDAEGNAVPSVQLSSDLASVKVGLEQLSNYRDLPVVVRWRGQPAEGYAVTSISADPQAVTVFGPIEAIQNLKGYIETQDVVISGAKGDVNEQTGLVAPPTVTMVNGPTEVKVRMKVEPIQGSRTLKRKPAAIGVSPNLTPTISPNSISLVLNGPLPKLNSLTDDDVRVVVDVTGLGAGTYQITPRVVLPDDVFVQSLVPATVQVELAGPKKRP